MDDLGILNVVGLIKDSLATKNLTFLLVKDPGSSQKNEGFFGKEQSKEYIVVVIVCPDELLAIKAS